ncbi:putative small nuclear ribonucleoprotein sm d3 [Diaporthe ampelina]|uniref:Small nuclear ribonucleoprotein Sm D3 n=1 Tax=Diaporthe ampelina TaxID=1214573 RepID=A0A0G2F433_9PEZI|nr:putative small nuclear ribonucleoprotein sm d3 [Diaporthe ampelina]
MTSTIGIPIKLLNEAQGHIITLELDSGTTYRGKLIEAEDNMNIQLKDITVTARDGRVSHLEQVYIRGSHVRFFIVPDMLRYAETIKPPSKASDEDGNDMKRSRLTNLSTRVSRNAPMFKSRNARGRGVGLARGRATVSRARASGRGGR